MAEVTREVINRLSKEMADQGKLIEAGWLAMRAVAIPLDAPQAQLDDLRMAFMAGAQHLFSSIMIVLDEGEDPTEVDLRRMDLIDTELRAFVEEMKERKRHAQ